MRLFLVATALTALVPASAAAGDLEALAAAAAPAETAPAEPAPATPSDPAPVVVEPAPPILVVVEIGPAPAVEAAPVEAPAAEPVADLGDAPPDDVALPFSPAPVSIGLSGLVGTHEAGDELAPTWTAGLDLGFRIDDLVSVGARRLTATSSTHGNDAWAFGLSPYVELGWRPWERIEPYFEIGAALEMRTEGAGVGAAPFGTVGIRFFPADIFSIAIEGTVHVPATRTFLLGHETFPLGAVLFQGGLAFAFHVG